MQTKITAAVVAVIALSAVACSPTNPDKGPPPTVQAEVAQNTPVAAQVEYKPKADILFVIDNSVSMDVHQLKLRKNIDEFVQAFGANEQLDFHIGVVSIFDTTRFGSKVQDFYPLGKLRPLVDPQHPGEAVAGPPYVTRAPRFSEILGATLNIGTIPLSKGGPEVEESFPAVIAAIDGRNPGFIRPDAHLAIVFLTDGDDWSNMSASEFDSKLLAAKGRPDRYSAYGVLAVGEGCKKDPGLKLPNGTYQEPARMLELLAKMHTDPLSLCDTNFGPKLAAIGRTIEEKAASLRVDLKAIPDMNTLKVTFGGVDVPQDASTGWTYDPQYVQLVFAPEAFAQSKDPNAKLAIDYLPVDPRKMGKAHVQSMSPALSR